MIRSLLPLSLVLLIGIIFGCSSGGKSPVTPEMSDSEPAMVSTDHGLGGMMLGAYMVDLDGAAMSAEFEPARVPSAIGDPFLLGITQGGPAGKWFKITGVEFLSHDEDTMKDVLSVKLEFEHPFPITARPDLAGWDLKAIMVYDDPSPINFNALNVKMNPPILKNAYAATSEWNAESDLIFPTEANVHQFVILSEDNRAVEPFDFNNPQGWNVFHPGMTAEGSLDIEIDSGSSLRFMIFMTMGYEISATFYDTVHNPGEPGSRENPIYSPPNGNSRAAWKVEVEEIGVGMIDEVDSETTYRVKIWDWQHADLYSNSRIRSVSIFIPGVTNSAYKVEDFTGSGRGNDPAIAEITVRNDTGSAGDAIYPALIKVQDDLTGTPGLVDGIKTDWETQFYFSDFDTYRYFDHNIRHYDPARTSLFDVALAQFDATRDDLYYDSNPNSLWKAGDEVFMFPIPWESKMPDFDDYFYNPLRFPGYVESYTTELRQAANSGSYSGILAAKAKRLGYPFAPPLYSYTETSEPLLDAIASFHQTVGSPLSSSDRATISSNAEDIPMSVQIIAAKCLTAAKHAWSHNEAAWAPFTAQQREDAYNHTSLHRAVIESFNVGQVMRGGAEILKAFEDIRPMLETFTDGDDYNFEWTTPVGRIVIAGDTDNHHTGSNYLLLLDTGGNNVYEGNIAGNSSQTNTVSIAIDFAGDDFYGNDTEEFSQGGARNGIAVLWDFSGDDEYHGRRFNQGAARYGCGILIDSSGNDQYNGDQYAQGSGDWCGAGLLIDEAGNDRYYSFQCSQAFAYVRGTGTLLDYEGDDVYIADDEDIRYPSAQTNEHNASLSQAAAFGYRNDAQNLWLAGGIATLLDFGGSDSYSCGVFGQSTAFMYGTAILCDYGHENDDFYGIWYVQSATAHMGVSYLYSEGGDSRFEATRNAAMGGAHDFSHSWFINESGNDTYIAPAISLGGGNELGIGIFIDLDGDDTYTCTSNRSLGGGTFSDRADRPSYGIFIDDGGGDDIYTHPNAGNDTEWSNGETGGGVDGDSG